MRAWQLIKWAAERNAQFFLRQNSNYEWEAGWGDLHEDGYSDACADAKAAVKRLYKTETK